MQVALVKIDIEGHDLEALRGIKATIAAHKPLILTECTYTKDLRDLCNEWRYGIFASLAEL
jgi:hypothetical protein